MAIDISVLEQQLYEAYSDYREGPTQQKLDRITWLESMLETGQGPAEDGKAVHIDRPDEIDTITEKLSPGGGDFIIIEDGADSNNKKKVDIGNLPTGGGGESNTSSNSGAGGVGIVLPKSGINLPFKSINAGSSKITVTDDVANNEIDIDVDETTLTITESQISDLDHTDANAIHDNVAGEISVITEKVTPASGDFLILEDSAAGNVKKRLQIGNLPGGGDVTGPASSVDNRIVTFDGITGKLIKDSGVLTTSFASSSHTHAATDITSGVFANARIQASNVTQHQAALSITESQISDLAHTTDASLLVSGVLANARVQVSNVTQHQAALTITESQISDLSHVDANAIHDNVANEISAITNKASANVMDYLLIEDADAAGVKKHILVSALPFSSTGHTHTASEITDFDTEVSNNASVVANTAKTSFPGFTSLLADYAFTDNSTNWNTAFGWGDHSLGGYLTSQTSHADVVVDGDFASNGILKRTALGVYGIVTDNSANWNTAFGWGDHGAAGYLTSFSETNDLTAAVVWANIPIANIPTGTTGITVALGNHLHTGVYEPVDATIVRTTDIAWNAGDWDTAFGWGDHGVEGYLTSQISHADVVVDGDFASNGILKRTALGVYAIVTDSSANWNTAFGWGDHAGLYAAASHTHAATDIISGTFANARISVGSVTQHQASLSITESQISDLTHTDTDAIHDNVNGEINAVTQKVTPTGSDILLIEDAAATFAKKKIAITALPFADSVHNHTASDITDFDTEVSNNASVVANTAKTSFPGFTSLLADYSFTDNSTNWNTAFGWGNHASGGYADDTAVFHKSTAAEISALTLKVTPIDADHLLIEDSAVANAKKRVTVGSLPYAQVSHNHAASDITSGTFADARISATSVIQHEGDLDLSILQSVTAGTWKMVYWGSANTAVEIALGADGEMLMSNGPAAAPTFEQPVTIDMFQVEDDGTTGQTTTNTATDLAAMWATPSIDRGGNWSWNGTTGELTVTNQRTILEFDVKVNVENVDVTDHELHVQLLEDPSGAGSYSVVMENSQYAYKDNTYNEGGSYIFGFKRLNAADGTKYKVRVFHVGTNAGDIGINGVRDQTYISVKGYQGV